VLICDNDTSPSWLHGTTSAKCQIYLWNVFFGCRRFCLHSSTSELTLFYVLCAMFLRRRG